MENKQQQLFDKLLELCDSMVSEAYVVTNGLKVSSIVLDKKIAEFLCREMRKQYNSDTWVYLSIPQAIEYAFSCGREYAMDEIKKFQEKKIEQPVDASVRGDESGENSEFRKSNV